jgi:hypothetical protein
MDGAGTERVVRVGGANLESYCLVPKLLLGNEVVAQALLERLNSESGIIFPSKHFAKWNLASRGVPKQERGNQG